MNIGQKLASLEQRLAAVERASRLSSAAIDDTALEVRDATGSLRALVGQQADGTTAVNIVNGTPPPAPSTPSVAPALGGIAVSWDGQFADGSTTPLDWSRVEVHASTTAGFTPTADTLQATMETPQGAIAYLPATAPTYVRLLARNTSGAASAATSQVGPFSPRPVAGDIGVGEITETLIADGSITTPKIFALAVTTAKLAAGSVDAVALKADAITGKTISGGTMTGTVVQTAPSGARIVLEGNTLSEYKADGTLIAAIQADGSDYGGGFWTRGFQFPNNVYSMLVGGALDFNTVNRLAAEDGRVEWTYYPTVDGTEILLTSGRGAAAGAAWLQLQSKASDNTRPRAEFNANGSSPVDVRIRGALEVTETTWTAYTPTVAGGGSATFTSRTGWYTRLGKLVHFTAEFVVNAAGSGTSPVTITAPTDVYRGTRQVIPCHTQSTTTSGAVMNGHAVALETGSGTVIDRISVSNDGSSNRDNVLNGSNLLAGARVTVSGFYREA